MKPFKYGCVVTKEAFCPRPELQKRLVGYVLDGQNVALVGERRMGKTSLVYATCRALRGYKMLYVDLLNVRTVADFCSRVATAAAQMGTKESFVSRAVRLMSRLRPTLSVDPDNGMPIVSVDARVADDPRSMTDVVSLIERYAADERLFVVFDEFQELRKIDDADQVLALLRSKIQMLEDTCFVFSGSVRSDMVSIFTDPESAFYKSALTVEVPCIPDDVFAPFLIGRFLTGHRKASREFINEIFDFTNRITGDVQQLCAAVWNTTDENASLKSEDLKAALEDIFATEGGQFEYQTANLTRNQMKTLSALARVGGVKVYSSGFISQAGVQSSAALEKALKRLVENRLVYLYHGEYRFFNPFLKAWIMRHA